jgi:hypothetical protein
MILQWVSDKSCPAYLHVVVNDQIPIRAYLDPRSTEAPHLAMSLVVRLRDNLNGPRARAFYDLPLGIWNLSVH